VRDRESPGDGEQENKREAEDASGADAATLTGGQAPTGTIEFRLYGPSPTASCTGTPVDDETVAVSGDGNYATPAGATVSQPGTYWWTATYNGDSSNNPVSSGCALESVTIGP
jgi:hypothetical protein